ncbi:hypothetical protein LCGC14_0634230 [marine sediment metagenome]|uniref:Uncharacterized protein n=1 Tax=marine sediment metagenome TaxID=412755 RepID=A0A0F9TMJ1_9ZZZZ
MLGENGQDAKGDPQGTGLTSGDGNGSTSPPTSYTPEQANKLVSDALAKQGREHKAVLLPITSERDTLKVSLTSKDGELADITADRDAHRTTAEDLASEDTTRFNMVKREGTLRTGEATLKTGLRQLEADKVTLTARTKVADDTLREITVMDVATGKKDASGKVLGSPEKLKEVCETIGATTEDQIQSVADTLWPDAVTTAAAQLKILPGTTSGGAQGLNGLTPEEKVRRGLAALNKR